MATEVHDGRCDGAFDALASCATAKVCNEEISTYLPGASRSALIALEGRAGYSEEEFDGYCLSACQARDSRVDRVAFARDVCGVGVSSSAQAPVTNAAAAVWARGFSLHGKLKVEAQGVPLAEVIGAFGEPKEKRATPHECGSAFNEGTIQEFTYSDFSLETDGQTAVIRSMKFGDGNKLLLSNDETFEAAGESRFKKTFGTRAKDYDDFYRTSASPGGDLEAAYDFFFVGGSLDRVEYWIGC